jgi:hypothetical protein
MVLKWYAILIYNAYFGFYFSLFFPLFSFFPFSLFFFFLFLEFRLSLRGGRGVVTWKSNVVERRHPSYYSYKKKKKIVTQSRTGLQIYEGHDDQLN